jgi:hypothetical protein
MARAKPAPVKKSGRRNRRKLPAVSATTYDDQKRLLESKDFLRQQQLIAERVAEYGNLVDVPDFGVHRLTITDAAELVARDMWFSDAPKVSTCPRIARTSTTLV